MSKFVFLSIVGLAAAISGERCPAEDPQCLVTDGDPISLLQVESSISKIDEKKADDKGSFGSFKKDEWKWKRCSWEECEKKRCSGKECERCEGFDCVKGGRVGEYDEWKRCEKDEKDKDECGVTKADWGAAACGKCGGIWNGRRCDTAFWIYIRVGEYYGRPIYRKSPCEKVKDCGCIGGRCGGNVNNNGGLNGKAGTWPAYPPCVCRPDRRSPCEKPNVKKAKAINAKAKAINDARRRYSWDRRRRTCYVAGGRYKGYPCDYVKKLRRHR